MKDEKKVEMKFWEELGRKIGKKEVMMMDDGRTIIRNLLLLFLIINRHLWPFSCPSVAKLLRSRIWPQMGSDRKSWTSWRKLAQSSTSLQSNSTLKGHTKVQTQDCLLWGSSDDCCATKMANLIKFKQKEEKSGLDLGKEWLSVNQMLWQE